MLKNQSFKSSCYAKEPVFETFCHRSILKMSNNQSLKLFAKPVFETFCHGSVLKMSNNQSLKLFAMGQFCKCQSTSLWNFLPNQSLKPFAMGQFCKCQTTRWYLIQPLGVQFVNWVMEFPIKYVGFSARSMLPALHVQRWCGLEQLCHQHGRDLSNI